MPHTNVFRIPTTWTSSSLLKLDMLGLWKFYFLYLEWSSLDFYSEGPLLELLNEVDHYNNGLSCIVSLCRCDIATPTSGGRLGFCILFNLGLVLWFALKDRMHCMNSGASAFLSPSSWKPETFWLWQAESILLSAMRWHGGELRLQLRVSHTTKQMSEIITDPPVSTEPSDDCDIMGTV
jgi:hypothetical protein